MGVLSTHMIGCYDDLKYVGVYWVSAVVTAFNVAQGRDHEIADLQSIPILVWFR